MHLVEGLQGQSHSLREKESLKIVQFFKFYYVNLHVYVEKKVRDVVAKSKASKIKSCKIMVRK